MTHEAKIAKENKNKSFRFIENCSLTETESATMPTPSQHHEAEFFILFNDKQILSNNFGKKLIMRHIWLLISNQFV